MNEYMKILIRFVMEISSQLKAKTLSDVLSLTFWRRVAWMTGQEDFLLIRAKCFSFV